MREADRAAVTDLFRGARAVGLMGPGSVDDHVEHSQAFVAALAGVEGLVADLGSGAGVPGLVVALELPHLRMLLIESSSRRADHLDQAIVRLGLSERVEVDARRAEEVGRDPVRRGQCDAVIARSFAAPAVTAECAAPLLRVGGRLVVSEPPDSVGARWSELAGGPLPLVFDSVTRVGGATVAVITMSAPCPDTYPRRVGTPAKRPLF